MLIYSSRSITFDGYWFLSRCFTFCKCFAYDVVAGIFLSRYFVPHSWSIVIMVCPLLFQDEASKALVLFAFTTCDDWCDRLSISDLAPLISIALEYYLATSTCFGQTFKISSITLMPTLKEKLDLR